MEGSPLSRLSSAALALGGVTGAAFVIVSRGEIIGALAMLSQRWLVAHNLHFISATLLLFGVVGLYLTHSSRMDVLGHFSFVLAIIGTAFYFASGVLTAAFLPFIAGTSPNVVSAHGPLFNPPLPIIFVSIGFFSLGWLAVGIVTSRAGIVPKWAGRTVAIGAVIQAILPQPFGPVPWLVTDLGWVTMAVGLIGIGIGGWRAATPASTRTQPG